MFSRTLSLMCSCHCTPSRDHSGSIQHMPIQKFSGDIKWANHTITCIGASCNCQMIISCGSFVHAFSFPWITFLEVNPIVMLKPYYSFSLPFTLKILQFFCCHSCNIIITLFSTFTHLHSSFKNKPKRSYFQV